MAVAVGEPEVSICVPTFNGARHLEACLESVVAQTFDDFEVLVVDDASTDDTVAVVERFRGALTRGCGSSATPTTSGWCPTGTAASSWPAAVGSSSCSRTT